LVRRPYIHGERDHYSESADLDDGLMSDAPL
jgi:hypothetical protein